MGAILVAMRIRKGWSQEELALKLNRSRSSVAKLEKDRQTLDAPTLIQWAKETSSQEVLVAYFCGMDGLSIMQQIFGQMMQVVGA